MSEADRDIVAALRLLEEGEGGVEPGPERDAADSLLSLPALATDPVLPSASARARLLEATRPATRFAGLRARVAQLLDFSEAQARALLARIGDRAEELVGWVEGDVPGSLYFHFDGGPRLAHADCGLVRVEPGVEFPAHRHLGSEISIVLAGRAIEDTGTPLEPGDLVVREPDSVHAYRAVGDEPFVFVVVLSDGIAFV